MELKIDDIKASLIRLQGQIDVWQNLYTIAQKLEETKNADVVSQA